MTEPAAPRLAATILLVRDGPEGLEVAMVVRNRQIDFASGALVFPGGSVDAADGAGGSPDEALRIAAIREAFEECGVLLARRDGALLDADAAAEIAARRRADVEARRITMREMAAAEGLELAADLLAPFAHWVTPGFMKKRFDTHFFIAEAPDHTLAHDGGEAVEALWIRPEAALDAARAGNKTVVFATWLNLERAGEAHSAADAIARASRATPVRVEPTLSDEGGRKVMRLPSGAGYRADAWEIENLAAEPKPLKGR